MNRDTVVVHRRADAWTALAAGVSGAGLATLAGGLSAHRPELLDDVGLIVGIDRFMSEARALTNFAGNAIATVLVATWTRQLDREQLSAALSGERPLRRVPDDRRPRRRPAARPRPGPCRQVSADRDVAERVR
jgi:aerobic C4-dicarboxylate transport protein